MADKPILFSGPMVRALLAGTKTQTRRLMPNQAWLQQAYAPIVDGTRIYNYSGEEEVSRAKFAVGDRLYVREHWRTWAQYDGVAPRDFTPGTHVAYEATESPNLGNNAGRFRQGMHMPRWASRLTLTVTDVRVERLQNISEADAKAEGILDGGCLKCGESSHPDPCGCVYPEPCFADAYFALWNEINGKDASVANPWVAAYSFTVEHGNIDKLARAA